MSTQAPTCASCSRTLVQGLRGSKSFPENAGRSHNRDGRNHTCPRRRSRCNLRSGAKSPDPETINPRMTPNSFGEWALEDLSESYYIEREGWAPERAARVADRLQEDRPLDARLRVIVFFGNKETAFTTQGPFVFLSRRLLERCRTDAACAWIIAHEIAHHDLGHVGLVPDWMLRYVKRHGAWIAAALAQSVAHRILGPEREAEADRHAVDLCLRARYHPHDFLEALDAMEALIRDVGSQEAIYGPDFALLDELDDRTSVLSRLRVWQWQRSYGYFPLRERRSRIEAYLNGLALSELDLQRESRASKTADRAQDPWKLSPEERGLFTSPPSAPQPGGLEQIVRIGSGAWIATPAPHSQVILFSTEDRANRMLSRITHSPGVSFGEAAAAAIPAVHRRWWRGPDDTFYVVHTDHERTAVVARLPEGPWKPDMTAITCLWPSTEHVERALPWRNLAHASLEELEAMRNGDVVIAAEQDVELVEKTS